MFASMHTKIQRRGCVVQAVNDALKVSHLQNVHACTSCTGYFSRCLVVKNMFASMHTKIQRRGCVVQAVNDALKVSHLQNVHACTCCTGYFR